MFEWRMITMAWDNSWGAASASINPTPANPWDAKSQDEVLMHWQELKDQLAKIKDEELEFRKYIVSRAFPQKEEGTNTLELGNGYELKAVVKFNYKLADNDIVEAGLSRIAKIGNEGAFIADRLVSWHPNFLVSEFRTLQENADKGSGEARAILKEVESFLTITDAAPTLNIKEPKKVKK